MPTATMSTSVGVLTFTETIASGFTARIQSTCFLWSSTEYTLWKGKGENSDVHATASRMDATTSVVLPPRRWPPSPGLAPCAYLNSTKRARSEEHTSELQSQSNLVCRLLL